MKVTLQALVDAYREFTGVNQKMQALSDELQGVERVLQSMSGLEEYTFILKNLRDDIENTQTSVGVMCQMLDTACQYYTECEIRICNYCEGSAAAYSFYKTEFHKLGGVADNLKAFNLI